MHLWGRASGSEYFKFYRMVTSVDIRIPVIWLFTQGIEVRWRMGKLRRNLGMITKVVMSIPISICCMRSEGVEMELEKHVAPSPGSGQRRHVCQTPVMKVTISCELNGQRAGCVQRDVEKRFSFSKRK